MVALDFSEVRIEKLITHHVGNPMREDEQLLLSENTTKVEGETVEYFLKYLLTAFKPIDFYNFSHPIDIERNDIYEITKTIFQDNNAFIEYSKSIAKLLYENSNHPKVKAGELNVILLDDVILGDEMMQVIGIFKSENNVPFIKMNATNNQYKIEHDFGFEIKKMDKGCLIFNIEHEVGYRVLVIDNVNKQADAQYWVNDFLQLQPLSDEFYHTKSVLNLTKEFLTEQAPAELEKTAKIDLLNKTISYFKTNENFQQDDFEEVIFEDANLRQSFQEFKTNAEGEGNFESVENFEISSQAVKSQAKNFKSVLKLDRNFSVYIHGDKSLIQKGKEEDGRKFYKIYYEEEK